MGRYILDGSNISRHRTAGEQSSDFGRVISLIDALHSLGHEVTCYLDANERWKVALEVQPLLDRCVNSLNPLFIQTDGAEADKDILEHADEDETFRIISNDRFGPYMEDFPWLNHQPGTPMTQRRVAKIRRRADTLIVVGIPESPRGYLRVPRLTDDRVKALIAHWCANGWQQPLPEATLPQATLPTKPTPRIVAPPAPTATQRNAPPEACRSETPVVRPVRPPWRPSANHLAGIQQHLDSAIQRLATDRNGGADPLGAGASALVSLELLVDSLWADQTFPPEDADGNPKQLHQKMLDLAPQYPAEIFAKLLTVKLVGRLVHQVGGCSLYQAREATTELLAFLTYLGRPHVTGGAKEVRPTDTAPCDRGVPPETAKRPDPGTATPTDARIVIPKSVASDKATSPETGSTPPQAQPRVVPTAKAPPGEQRNIPEQPSPIHPPVGAETEPAEVTRMEKEILCPNCLKIIRPNQHRTAADVVTYRCSDVICEGLVSRSYFDNYRSITTLSCSVFGKVGHGKTVYLSAVMNILRGADPSLHRGWPAFHCHAPDIESFESVMELLDNYRSGILPQGTQNVCPRPLVSHLNNMGSMGSRTLLLYDTAGEFIANPRSARHHASFLQGSEYLFLIVSISDLGVGQEGIELASLLESYLVAMNALGQWRKGRQKLIVVFTKGDRLQARLGKNFRDIWTYLDDLPPSDPFADLTMQRLHSISQRLETFSREELRAAQFIAAAKANFASVEFAICSGFQPENETGTPTSQRVLDPFYLAIHQRKWSAASIARSASSIAQSSRRFLRGQAS